MVPSIGWNGRLDWCVGVFVLLTGVCSTSCGASVTSLVRRADRISVLHMVGSKPSITDCAKLSILVGSGRAGLRGASALEPRSSRAGSVVVLGGWAVTLFALVMARKPDLSKGAEEEKEAAKGVSLDHEDRNSVNLRSNKSHSKACLVQAARESKTSRVCDGLVVACAKSTGTISSFCI